MNNILIKKNAFLLDSALLQGKAYRALSVNLEKSLALFDLTILQWKILSLSYYYGEITHSQLADTLYVERPLITKVIKQLQKKMLVIVKRSKEDKRYKGIVPTKKGRSIIPDVERSVRDAMNFLFRGLSSEKIVIYKEILETIISNFLIERR